MKIISSLCLLGLLTATSWCAHDLSAATYTVDATLGKDATESGSASAPYKTLAYLWSNIRGGDTVYLKGGPKNTVNNYTFPYGSYPYYGRGPSNIFTSWVYFIGDSAQTVSFTNTLSLGADGFQYHDYTAYMSFTNVTFQDRIVSYGANYVALSHCKIQQSEPLRGPSPQGWLYNDLAGILIRWSSNWTVDHCEFTHSGFGMYWGASNSTITNNLIHDVSQDGIDFTGCTNVLFQGNTIYNCDDGGPIDPITGQEFTWCRHCDAIQFLMQSDSVAGENTYITIRGNKAYNVQGQCVIFDNASGAGGYYHNNHVLIENNIFGPCNSPVVNNFAPCDYLVFRNNTVCQTPGNYTFTDMYRTITASNFTVRWQNEVGLEVYNNLLCGDSSGVSAVRLDHNIYQSPVGATLGTGPLPPGCVRTSVPQLVNPTKFDGVLVPGSIAMNAGTRLTVTQNQIDTSDGGVPSTDYYGTVRDNLPDCGAYETANQHPPAAPVVQLVTPTNPTIFVGNFACGNLNVDPTLGTPTTSGLGWSNAAANGNNCLYLQNYNDGVGNQLTEPMTTSPVTCLMNNVPSVTNFILTFSVSSSWSADGGGPCFLQTDAQNFYWLRLGASTAAVHRIKGGVDTQVLLLPGFSLSSHTLHSFTLSVLQSPAGAAISVSRDHAITQSVNIPSSQLPSANQFSSIGLYRLSPVQYQRLTFSNFRLQIGLPSPPTNLRVAGATS